jgi:hypothetical protein
MKIFNPPDRNSPRFRQKYLRILNLEFYKKLNKEYPDLELTNKEIKDIIFAFHHECTEVIANNRDGIELPKQLGFIVLGACKKKELPHNEGLSEQLGVQVYNKNWESNQWICKVCYTNYPTKYKFKNHRFWGFEAGRPLKKAVSNAFIANYKKYVILDNFMKIATLYRKDNAALRKKLEEQRKQEQ